MSLLRFPHCRCKRAKRRKKPCGSPAPVTYPTYDLQTLGREKQALWHAALRQLAPQRNVPSPRTYFQQAIAVIMVGQFVTANQPRPTLFVKLLPSLPCHSHIVNQHQVAGSSPQHGQVAKVTPEPQGSSRSGKSVSVYRQCNIVVGIENVKSHTNTKTATKLQKKTESATIELACSNDSRQPSRTTAGVTQG